MLEACQTDFDEGVGKVIVLGERQLYRADNWTGKKDILLVDDAIDDRDRTQSENLLLSSYIVLSSGIVLTR